MTRSGEREIAIADESKPFAVLVMDRIERCVSVDLNRKIAIFVAQIANDVAGQNWPNVDQLAAFIGLKTALFIARFVFRTVWFVVIHGLADSDLFLSSNVSFAEHRYQNLNDALF